MREASIQKNIQKFCRQNDILSVKVDSTSSRGWPDLTCVLPNGVVLFVELKTATGKTSALQERMLTKIKANRGNAHVIRSEEEFRTLVNAHLTD